MEIRAAEERDIPAIVELLRLSLGESLMPKSEAFWRWKHVENPFGKSPVLVAEENGKLIGVRAFMRWEWKQGDRIYKAVRAVDTATHPQHQGKGIFRKLTLQLVDQCKAEGVDFVFNTPNKISKPGYLKMGWQEAGRLPVRVSPLMFSGRASENFTEPPIAERLEALRTKAPALFHDDSSGYLGTNRSSDFIKWRYASNPNVRYHLAHDEGGTWAMVFRLKPGQLGTEFRVCEFWKSSAADSGAIKHGIVALAKRTGARLITWSGFSLPLAAPSLRFGPMVTVRPLHDNISLSFANWKPTLGDMEVF